jgi:branched-subunit amino acid aminotransferase/4-amino-4-deoxychorismate lyase
VTNRNAQQILTLIDGVIAPLEHSGIPINDRGFLFGEALFETILVRNGTPVCLEDHLERLKSSIAILGWKPPDVTQIQADINVLCGVGAPRSSLKIVVSSGYGTNFEAQNHFDSLSASLSSSATSNVYLILSPLTQNPDESQPRAGEQGLRLLAIPDPRPEIAIRLKTTGYLLNAQALALARNQGCDDALFFDNLNTFSESTSAAFVWLSAAGDLRAAPASASCFASITVNRLMRALPQSPVSGQAMKREALHLLRAGQDCVAAFLLSSVRGARPIRKIRLPDSRSITFDSNLSRTLSHNVNKLLESH